MHTWYIPEFVYDIMPIYTCYRIQSSDKTTFMLISSRTKTLSPPSGYPASAEHPLRLRMNRTRVGHG